MNAIAYMPAAPTRDECDRIIREHDGLVGYYRRRLGRFPKWLRDDLDSAGYLGLWKAAKTPHDPSRGTFANFAGVCINREFYRVLLKNSKEEEKRRRFWREHRPRRLRRETASEAETNDERRAAADLVSRMLPTLVPRDRFVLTAYYGLDGSEPMNDPAIAPRIGLGRAGAQIARQRALARLRAQLDSAGSEAA